MTRKDKILLFGGLGVISLSYLIYNKWNKNILYGEIMKRIGGGSIKFNDLKVWNTSFLLNMKSIKKPYIELQQSVVKQKAEELDDAMRGVGTDEEQIISVFNSINSKVELAQVNSFYNAKYKSILKNDLQSELSKKWLNRIAQIISLKPDVVYI